jgi:hypothetical protein
MPQDKSLHVGFKVITEEAFMKASVGRSQVSDFMNKWGALVILGSDGMYYINYRGRCAVAVSDDDVVDFLKNVTGKSAVHSETKAPVVEKWPIDSINIKVHNYLSKVGINSLNVDEAVINRLDKNLANRDNRILDISPLYYTIGEYFRYSVGDNFEWENVESLETGVELPILISHKTREKILIENSLKTILSDQRFDSPIREAINLIFRLM